MLSLGIYKRCIEQLPLKEMGFKVNEKLWDSLVSNTPFQKSYYELKNDYLYNHSFVINRNDIFELAKQNQDEKFLLAILCWGYPTGGRGNNIKKILASSSLVNYITKVKVKKDFLEMADILPEKNIPGCSVSTYSKIWYFLPLKVNGYRCLILDDKLIKIFNQSLFAGFESLKKINRTTAFKKGYLSYIKEINDFSLLNSLPPENVEMFIYLFGDKLKASYGWFNLEENLL